jgi:DNA-binding MarR family transcriptional regulator
MEPSLVVLLTRAGQVVTRAHGQAAAAHGLTATSLGALGELARADGGSHRELAARLGVTPATLTPVVDALADGGHLVRERDPDDRRVVRLAITPRGRRRFADAAAAVEAQLGERMPVLTAEHEAVVRGHLLAVLAALGDG